MSELFWKKLFTDLEKLNFDKINAMHNKVNCSRNDIGVSQGIVNSVFYTPRGHDLPVMP